MTNQRLLIGVLTVLTAVGLCWQEPAIGALPPGNAIKDPTTILRNTLPIKEQKELRQLQTKLEETNRDVKGNRWNGLAEVASSSQFLESSRKQNILNAISADKKQIGETLLNKLEVDLQELSDEVNKKDKDGFIKARNISLNQIGELEGLLKVEEFPYLIPSEFNSLPRLLGRATVVIKTNKGEMKAIIDGYNAPLTAGAFIDLSLKGFYDGLPITRAEDFYILQSGDPEGPEMGYIDPKTNEERHVPLEIRIPDQQNTLYNQTFEDVGLYKATPTLPFSTLGTLGWAHSNDQLDDGSSQFFFFLYEPELTPAGLNLIDGRNAAFGYVIEGFNVLEKLSIEDQILSIKVIDGADLLKENA